MFGRKKKEQPAQGQPAGWQESIALAGNIDPTSLNDITSPWRLRPVTYSNAWETDPAEPKVRKPHIIGTPMLFAGGAPVHQYGVPRETRASTNEITTGLRREDVPFDHRLNGLYGVIAGQLPHDMIGSPWDVSRRTIRSSPPELWDQGTAIGAPLAQGVTPGE